MSWRLESGKWKAFGPTQGSLGIAEDSEKIALGSAGGANGTLIGDIGKFRIYDLGRLLGGGEMDVYRYARDAYKLDLSRFE